MVRSARSAPTSALARSVQARDAARIAAMRRGIVLFISAIPPRLKLVQHTFFARAVERKRRHVDFELLAALGHHLVAPGHEGRGGRQRHAAGVFIALARREHGRLTDSPGATYVLALAVAVGYDPVPAAQLHCLGAAIGDYD